MKTFNIIFTDSDMWSASIEVDAENTLTAIRMATEKIKTTDRGAELVDIVQVEVEGL